MIYDVIISDQANEDLRNIFTYIAYNLGSVQNAVGQLSRLEDKLLSLSNMPERFRRYEKEPWHSRGMRIMPVDNFCVIYIVDSQSEFVNILRVMYGGRDIDAELLRHI